MTADERALPKIFITPDDIPAPCATPLRQILDQELGVVRQSTVAGPSSTPAQTTPPPPDDDLSSAEIAVQTRASNGRLITLLRDGKEAVSNVLVANDRREIERRTKEAEARDELLRQLHAESELAMRKFDQIRQRWAALDELRDPFSMAGGLAEQQDRIGALMRQKDAIVDECRQELLRADINYRLAQARHTDDLDCLTERINGHVDAMNSAYRGQLECLQRAVDRERGRVTGRIAAQWQSLYEKRLDGDRAKVDRKRAKLLANDQEMERLICDHEELIRETRIRLEKDNECLQVELQRTKATVQLNGQKLDYNYEVLRRKEAEKLVIRSQQKRRLTRLYDTIAQLRQAIGQLTETGRADTNGLRNKIAKLQTQIREMERNAQTIGRACDDKYQQVWHMNYGECRALLERVCAMDRQLHEQELGLSVAGPSQGAEGMELDTLDKLPSYQAAVLALRDQLEQQHLIEAEEERGVEESSPMPDKSLAGLFSQIIESADFVLEDKLMEMLEPLQETDSKIIKLASIFDVLGIKSNEDADQLVATMKQYMWCSNCCDDQGPIGCASHDLVIAAQDVLPAILEYRTLAKPTAGVPLAVPPHHTVIGDQAAETVSRLLDGREVETFWAQFQRRFPSEKLWAGLKFGLNHYLKVLKEREQLFIECEQLRHQNVELSHLLEQQNIAN